MPSLGGRYLQVWAPTHPQTSGSGCIYEHVAVAERALGHYLLDGVEVHHVDGNGLNNANRNLVICQDRAYHMLLHVRARIVKAGSNPDTHAICSTCAQPKERREFNRFRLSKGLGLQKRCRECQSRLYKGYVRPSKRHAFEDKPKAKRHAA